MPGEDAPGFIGAGLRALDIGVDGDDTGSWRGEGACWADDDGVAGCCCDLDDMGGGVDTPLPGPASCGELGWLKSRCGVDAPLASVDEGAEAVAGLQCLSTMSFRNWRPLAATSSHDSPLPGGRKCRTWYPLICAMCSE
jgi:hypothetical protein